MKKKYSLKAWLARLFGYAPKHVPVNDVGDNKLEQGNQMLSLSAYEDRPNPHWFRQQRAGVLYRKAHGISDDDSHVPPSPAILIEPDAAMALLQSYGLDAVLTPEDDATLWAAIISAYWPQVGDAKINIEGLRFGVGTFDNETMMKLQPIAGWCFERANEKTLNTTICRDKDIDGLTDPKLQALPTTTLFTMASLSYDGKPPSFPNMSIVVECGSAGKQEVIVYNGAQLWHLAGLGQTGIYTRVVGGWQESGRILADWQS